jgi:predicted enzyme related to lactoylglutathione lyase
LFPSLTKCYYMESISPNIFVHDMHATIDFYEQLGFRLEMTVPQPGEGPLIWAMMKADLVTFMFQTFESLGQELPEVSRENGGSLLFYIHVKNIRSFFSRIESKVKVLKGLHKTFYGATEFAILDNNQYVLTFAEDEQEITLHES